MDNDPAYAPTLTETARGNIRRVSQLLIAETGASLTTLSRLAKGDSAFLQRLNETSISLRSYDETMGRFSAIWPDSIDWPDDVPRPAPIPVSDAARAEYEASAIRHRAAVAAEAARQARATARQAKAIAAHVSGRRSRATAGGDQAPVTP